MVSRYTVACENKKSHKMVYHSLCLGAVLVFAVRWSHGHNSQCYLGSCRTDPSGSLGPVAGLLFLTGADATESTRFIWFYSSECKDIL